MNNFPKKRGRRRGTKDSEPRKMNPNSLKNLAAPVQPGQVLNPTGKNGIRPVTDEYALIGASPLPELVRQRTNALLGCDVCDFLVKARGTPHPHPKLPKGLKHNDYLPVGISFNKSLAIRMYLAGVLAGSVHGATEVREAQEGRSTTRLEWVGKNDRLESLINALNTANSNPPPEPSPESAPQPGPVDEPGS